MCRDEMGRDFGGITREAPLYVLGVVACRHIGHFRYVSLVFVKAEVS